MQTALASGGRGLGTIGAVARRVSYRSLIDAFAMPVRPFTGSEARTTGRSILADVRPNARGGKALQELLDNREEDREEDDDTPVGKKAGSGCEMYKMAVEKQGFVPILAWVTRCRTEAPAFTHGKAPQAILQSLSDMHTLYHFVYFFLDVQ